MLKILDFIILKNNRSFGEEAKFEFQDLLNDFMDFFRFIKEHTYDVLVNSWGADITNLFGIALIAFLIMFIALKIINR